MRFGSSIESRHGVDEPDYEPPVEPPEPSSLAATGAKMQAAGNQMASCGGTLAKLGCSGFLLLAVIGIVIGALNSHSGSSSPPEATASHSEQGEQSGPENEPGKNASESNTPRVDSTGSVEVDDLRWHLMSAYTTSVLGEEGIDQQRANGVFVVAYLSVTDNKSESVSMTNSQVALVVDGKSYSPDSEAEFHLSGKTLESLEVGPGVTAEAGIVFDVAPQVLHEHPELQFNELGLGSTHGYIALPSLSS
jgi:hypothetical protein